MTRRVLITGGTGFVGSHLWRKCLDQGWQVLVLYRPGNRSVRINDMERQVQVYPVIGDTSEIFEIFDRFRPELVFHLAALVLPEHSPEDILGLVNSNITFGTQILDAISHFQVPYFVNTGTSWQHFENRDYNPVNLYAATKQAFDDILLYYIESNSLQAISLQLCDTYGPEDHRPKLLNLLEQAIRERKPLRMSLGEQLMDILYIDDVVNAFIVAARRLFAGKVGGCETYAVSSGQTIRLRDLVETYKQLRGEPLDIIWGGRSYRKREVMVPWSNGKYLPSWRPHISLEQGIRKTIRANKKSS